MYNFIISLTENNKNCDDVKQKKYEIVTKNKQFLSRAAQK